MAAVDDRPLYAMRERLYHCGPLTVALGHDVGIGVGMLGLPTVIVGRVWGVALFSLALFYVKNVTRNAVDVSPRPRPRPRPQSEDPFE